MVNYNNSPNRLLFATSLMADSRSLAASISFLSQTVKINLQPYLNKNLSVSIRMIRLIFLYDGKRRKTNFEFFFFLFHVVIRFQTPRMHMHIYLLSFAIHLDFLLYASSPLEIFLQGILFGKRPLKRFCPLFLR